MKQKTAKEMSEIITAYTNWSGSKKEFCTEHQIAVHTLDYWRRKLSPPSTHPSYSHGFVPLEIASSAIDLGYELCFPNGNQLKIPSRISMEDLQRLVKITC